MLSMNKNVNVAKKNVKKMDLQRPKVFISYSWSPISNKNWVKDLAERLSNNGVHVILDIWDLKEGHDKYHFMEKMVIDEEIKKVLLICNEDYCQKSNTKKGGVGTESMIISSEIYEQANQEKFIPIIKEYREDGKPWIPAFLASRLYIDLSSDEYYESEYERLIRNIYGKPSEKRPPIGEPPSYLFIDEPIFLRTAHKVKEVKRALIENKPNLQIFIDDYYQTFVSALNDHVLEKGGFSQKEDIDEVYMKEIEKMKPLRDDYINFFETLCKYSVEIDIDKLHSFFEALLNYRVNYQDLEIKIINRLTGCHIMFFQYEIFLYTAAIAIKYEKFQLLAQLLELPYFVNRMHDLKPEIGKFYAFNLGNYLFEYRNKRLGLNRISLEADTIKNRATNDLIHFPDLQEADLILYYISCLYAIDSKENEWNHPYWIPSLSVYDCYYYPRLNKLISKRYFDKFKVLLGVKSKEELVSKIEQLGDKNLGNIRSMYFRFPTISYGLKVDDIGKYK